jgi:hypothetical protein
LYRALLDYAVRTFTPKDILGFLGRKWDRRFDGEVHTHYENDRWFGTRIKHRMKSNWLKMYDKFGLILRVETVINSPKEFWVYRTRRHRDGTSSVGYYPMTKSVASLVDYQEQALACNRRYLDALAVVDDPTPAYPELRRLTEPKVVEGRSHAGFNPARRRAPLQGDPRRRPHRTRLSQRRHPRAVVRSREKGRRETPSERGGGAIVETLARASFGGQDPANPTLAGHRTRPTIARHGCSTLLVLLAATGGMIGDYGSKTSPQLAEKFTGKNLMALALDLMMKQVYDHFQGEQCGQVTPSDHRISRMVW